MKKQKITKKESLYLVVSQLTRTEALILLLINLQLHSSLSKQQAFRGQQ